MIYVEDNESRIYKVNCDTLEESIELIHRYEKYVYDLYYDLYDYDTWGWWEYRKYKIVDYDSIDNDDRIYDLSNYKFTVQEFCKSYFKGEENKNSDKWTWEKFSSLMNKLSKSSLEKDKRDLNTLREIFINLSKVDRNILYDYLQTDFYEEYPNYKEIADMPTKLNMLSNTRYFGWLIKVKQCGELEFMKKVNETENQYSNMTVDDKGNRHLLEYYEFIVAKYALSDCIEALTNNGVREIIVTKCDGDLIIRYKPYWKK